jgi:hypothetical protein
MSSQSVLSCEELCTEAQRLHSGGRTGELHSNKTDKRTSTAFLRKGIPPLSPEMPRLQCSILTIDEIHPLISCGSILPSSRQSLVNFLRYIEGQRRLRYQKHCAKGRRRMATPTLPRRNPGGALTARIAFAIARPRDDSLRVMGSARTNLVSTPCVEMGSRNTHLFPIPSSSIKGREYTLYFLYFNNAH